MNDLYLIGNGFDLAHGLETSYNHFLLWYLNDSLQSCNSKSFFNDKLITIQRDGYQYSSLENYGSLKELLGEMKRMKFSIKYNHDFFKNIVESYRDYKWVDIEYEYYMALVNRFKKLDNVENKIEWDDSRKQNEKEKINKDLEILNDCFAFILNKLEEYLDFARKKPFDKNKQIEEILFEETGVYLLGGDELIEKEIEKMYGESSEEKLFVCFNYTFTLERYLKHSSFESNLIYIHGELDEPSNPVIFGYGDEMDPFYEKIENLNSNEFLKNIKSFNYFKTDNYQRVLRFIDGKDRDFTVKILGHSCGLSDRILLNTIFEHDNCRHIKIYYYQKNKIENDYFEKTQEISRHFNASSKGEMRKKIVPFKRSSSLPQNPKDN